MHRESSSGSTEKGYGLIAVDVAAMTYSHYSAIESSGFRSLRGSAGSRSPRAGPERPPGGAVRPI